MNIRSKVVLSLLWINGLLGGLQVGVIGTLTASDVIVPLSLVSLFLFSPSLLRSIDARQNVIRSLLFLLMFIVWTVTTDNINEVPNSDILRGAARNFELGIALILGYVVSKYIDPTLGVWLFISTMTGQLLNLFVFDTERMVVLNHLLKYGFGTSIGYTLTTYLERRSITLARIVLFATGALALLFDVRSIFIMISGALVLDYFSRNRITAQKLFLALLLSAVITALGWIAENADLVSTFEYSRFDRRETSDSLRIEMAEDALNGFLNRPLLGNGSWQHARQFELQEDGGFGSNTMGVHSVVIQLCYEYGVIGLLVGVAIFLIPIRYSIQILLRRRSNEHSFEAVPLILQFMCIFLMFHWLFSPFANVHRILYGLSAGSLAGTIMVRSKKLQ